MKTIPSITTALRLALSLAVGASASVAVATPYASCLTNNAGVISFRLNESADNVKILWTSAGNPTTNDLGALPKGLTTTANLGVTGTYRIQVAKDAGPGYLQGEVNQISVDSNNTVKFANGRGLAVNTRPGSPFFGRVYVSCGSGGTVSSNEFTLGARTTGDGFYLLNADQTDAVGQGDTARTGGINVGSNAENPHRVAVGEDDNLYVSDFSDVTGTLYVTDPDAGGGTNVLYGLGGPFPVTSSRIHGSINGAVAEGSLANGNLTVYVIDEDLQEDRDSALKFQVNSIWRWDIGGNTLPYSNWPATRLISPGVLGGFAQTCELRRGPDGKFYVSQRRADNASTAGAFVISSDGLTQLWDSITDTRNFLGNPSAFDLLNETIGIDVTRDGKYMATFRRSTNTVCILPLTDGIPSIANMIVMPTVPTTVAGRAVAFDRANNIYTLSSGQGLLRIYSPGGNTTATTGSDGSFDLYAPAPPVVVSATATDAEAAEAGPGNAEFTLTRYGLDNSQPLAVRFTMSGTATNGVDYVLKTNGVTMNTNWVVIPAASDTVTISLVPTDDSVAELSETAVLKMAGWNTYGLTNPASATVVVADNEPPELQVTSWVATLYERLTNDYAQMNFTRRGDTNLEVYLDPTNFVSSGVATRDVDYYVTNATIAAGTINGSAAMVYPLDDFLLEGTETISISLAAVGGLGWTNRPNTNTLTIVDDEVLSESVLFADNFDTDTSANWTLRFAARNELDDFRTNWVYDYSADGIPPAPHSYGTNTVGLKLTVNKDEGSGGGGAGLNLYPNGRSFSGDYALRFDMYLRVGNAASTTEYALCGLNHSGNQTNWFRNSSTANAPNDGVGTNGWTYDGLWCQIEADGGALGDYVLNSAPAVTNGTILGPTARASQAAANLTATFKLPPFGPIRILPGAPGCDQDSTTPSWADVDLRQVGNVVTLRINSTVIMTYTNATATTSGNIMIGYDDAYDSVMAGDSAVIIDNLRVVALSPPTIITQPANAVADGGSTTNFAVVAAGTTTGFTNYQWRLFGTNLPGATSATLTLSNLKGPNYGVYSVVVSDGVYSVTSSNATLLPSAGTSIITPPSSVVAAAGTPASFSVVARTYTGTTNYQWTLAGTNVPGATASTYSIATVRLTNYGTYTVKVNDGFTNSVTSGSVTLTPPAPVINTQPSSRAAVIGNPASFTVVATTSTGATNYQWMRHGTNLAGATTATYTIANVQPINLAPHTVRVSDGFSTPLTSAPPAQLTQAILPSIGQLTLSGAGFGMTFGAENGPTYFVDYKNGLTDPVWIPLSTNAGNGSSITVTDDTVTSSPTRFYRVRIQ